MNQILKASSDLLVFSLFFSNGSGYNSFMPDELRRGGKDRLISLPEAAELYGFHPEYLGNLARKGRLRAYKVGGRWITTPQDVEIFIQSRKKRGVYRDDIHLD